MIPLLVVKSPLPFVESGESALVKVWCYHQHGIGIVVIDRVKVLISL